MSTLSRLNTRLFRGRPDLAGMAALINARMEAEGGDEYTTVEDMAEQYEHLQRCDPERDILVVEDESGAVVGYARTTWEDVSEGYRSHWVAVEASPVYPELEKDLFDWAEQRAREIAADQEVGDRRLSAWADEAGARAALLADRGYETVRYGATLIRPDLEEIPHRPLPDGIEVRPVEDEHLRDIWEADIEAFRDHPGYVEQTEEDWKRWLDAPNWDPTLWQIAWAGDRVVGQVRSFIDPAENRHFGRLRGYTEDITTARDRRGNGIASSLICSSLRLLRERGMEEAALGVDTENPSGAFRIYRSLGFIQTRLYGDYERRF